MCSSPSRSETGARREVLVVAAIAAAGGLLRLWSIGRLGLVHFDEGIYAMAGTWVFSPRGLAGIDPTVISYAPPGFPFLVGLAYWLLGTSDASAILVSIVAGTLTIPVAGWLGYRTFGRGAGAAAAAFAATSGPHIALSRMALTDASFLLAWLVAIGLGQRFIEKPGPARAAAMGLAVGVAQLFKYNGWLAGAVVALAAILATAIRPEDRSAGRQLRIWGWGAVAAAVAAVVYAPWFGFVESHGGYAALLAHHRGYLGGIRTWPAHAEAQMWQESLLSGGRRWVAAGGLSAAIALLAAVGTAGASRRSSALRIAEAIGLAGLASLSPSGSHDVALGLIALAAIGPRSSWGPAVVPMVGWGLLAAITPFYHPYARLSLPMQGLGWVLLGGAVAILLPRMAARSEAMGWPVTGVVGGALLAVSLISYPGPRGTGWSLTGLLEPSDSLRGACRSIAGELPKDLAALRLYARPPVTFYLSGGVPVVPQPTSEALLATPAPRTWAVLDSALLRQEGGVRGRLTAAADRWDLVREYPTTLNLPTWLDVDPTAGDGRSAPLMLFRPRTR